MYISLPYYQQVTQISLINVAVIISFIISLYCSYSSYYFYYCCYCYYCSNCYCDISLFSIIIVLDAFIYCLLIIVIFVFDII